jgi:hypothetical protein
MPDPSLSSQGEVAGMSPTEHWVAAHPTYDYGSVPVWDAAEADRLKRGGWALTGPYVLASQLQGAVEALRSVYDAERGELTAQPWEVRDAIRDALARLAVGGQ